MEPLRGSFTFSITIVFNRLLSGPLALWMYLQLPLNAWKARGSSRPKASSHPVMRPIWPVGTTPWSRSDAI
jgi:hypothetical protein